MDAVTFDQLDYVVKQGQTVNITAIDTDRKNIDK